MTELVYKGSKTKEISFPLGGIGTGCIGLAGNGRLIDWEIFNRPNKGGTNGFSFFCVKAQSEGVVKEARVLNGDLQTHYMGNLRNTQHGGYGHGPEILTTAGIPHFKDVEFKGEYPLAELKFSDDNFPGQIKVNAFNPFIPLNDRDSSIPGAFFETEVENTTGEALEYTVCLALSNPFTDGGNINTYKNCDDGLHIIRLSSGRFNGDEPEAGDISAATDWKDTSYQEYWYRGGWFDSLGIFWRDFTAPGKLSNRTYEDSGNRKTRDVCSLAAHASIPAGEKRSIRFIITWNFPNCYNYWSSEKCECGDDKCGQGAIKTWKNYYATIYGASDESAGYSLKNWNRLYEETLTFKNALFSSSLPEQIIDAVSANISILKTPTCLRLEDGSFYGFEGCNCTEGCCEGSCTHVWNYAYALPFLFPRLERSMRELNYRYNQDDNGAMSFRLQLPPGRKRSAFRPCADGQFGDVIKTYRDWKISGDTEWLKSLWEAVKKSIDFAWHESNNDRWDRNRDGVLEGRQHHTLDMELFGPNSWLTGFYLAALKAGSEIAAYLGEQEKAREYYELYDKGKKWVEDNLFNGRYYHQSLDLKDISALELYDEGGSLCGSSTLRAYWNDEEKEIKYQAGEGCMVDQIIAQWHANICGLGEIFDSGRTYKALQSIYRYNYKKSMRDHFNPCRIYALNDEAGVVICDWPEGKYKPVVPVPYAEEAWSGCEYQVAAHMIQEGLVNEGIEIVKAVRDRYDGEKRNPWNEIECGSNYARSMASYSLIVALSGFEFNMVEGMIGFNPVYLKTDGEFKCFWSLDSGWGTFEIKTQSVELTVLYGKLDIRKVKLGFAENRSVKYVGINNRGVDFTKDKSHILFDMPVTMGKGDILSVSRPV